MSRRRRKKPAKPTTHAPRTSPEAVVAVSPFSEMELDFFRRGDEPFAPSQEVFDESSIRNL